MKSLKYIFLTIGIFLTIITLAMAYKTHAEVKLLDARAEQSRQDRKLMLVKFYLADMEKTSSEMNESAQEIDRAHRKIIEIREELRLKRIVQEAIRDQ